MENQESELSVDMSQNNPGQPNAQSMYGMQQQNQQMPFNQNPSMYQNNPMNMSSQSFVQPTQQSMSQPNNFSSYGQFGQSNNMMPNQGMMQPGMDFFSNAMRNFNPQQQQQQQQPQQPMMPNQTQNQGLNPMEFFAMANSMIMNNNMSRNPMGGNQYANLNQPMNMGYMGFPQNTSGMMNPAMLQSMMSNSRGFDDSFSQNMGSMADFYRMMNSGASTGMNATPMNVNMRKGTAESDMALPNRTEFTQGGFGSMNGLPSNQSQSDAPHFGNDQNKGMTLDDLNAKDQRNSNFRDDPRKNTPEERGKFDWEDRPINSKKGNNPPAEYEDDNDYDPRGASQNSADYAAREYKNPYDEVPISMKGKNKRFEDMLEEELKANPDAVGSGKSRPKPAKKTFLKRGQRNFLASAGAAKGQKENISSLNDIQDDGISSGIPSTKNSSLKPNNNFGNQMQRGRNQKEKFEDAGLEDEPEQRQTQRSKEPKKFLARGAGKGGGKGNPLDEKQQRKTHVEEKSQERVEERSKSVNPKSKKKDSERTLKTEKSQGQLKTSARQELYPDNGPSDTHSLEREYNLEKHLKKSPKGRKMLEAKAKKSPNYVFDEGNDSDGDYRGDNDFDDGRAETIEDGPAPVSNLVNKYFYAKGNPKAGAGKGKQEESEEDQNTGDENVQKFVNEKIEILNSEIAKFKLENERVKKIRQKHEEMLKNLNKDIAEWNKQKERDIKEFKDWKQEETKKITNEKKLADRQQKTLANMPNRKEREEIETLKKHISKMMEDMQHKEKRAKLDMDRLKRQVKESEERNTELLNELRGYDGFRAKEAAAAQQNRRGNYEDEEDQEEEDYDDDGGNKRVIEEEEEDEEQEGGSDENNDLQYDDIVIKGNVETNKRAGAGIGTFHSPKFMGGADKKELIGNGRPSAVKGKEPARAVNGKWSEDDYKFDTNACFLKHFVNKNEVARIVNQTVSPDGKIQRIYADQKKEVIFHNGVKREIFPDGYTIVHFTNNDIKQTLPDQTIIYYFADAQTTQTTLPNGLHIYRFANNQLEFHNQDGSKDIHFADGTRKVIHINGEEETVFTDGTVQRVNAQKIKTIDYANKQRDIVYPDGLKIRTYPNGKTKKYYPDGTVEEN
jgi:centromere protein J